MQFPIHSVAWAIVVAYTLPAVAQNHATTLTPVIVQERALSDQAPVFGVMEINPKDPAHGVHGTDGASILQNVPNLSLSRKGQQSGDPVFRGLGGSRLAITANDQTLYGGCGIRMDSPTVYINPASYDEIIITKGPQTVTKGGGLIAGAVEFKRHPLVFTEPGLRFSGNAGGGSNGFYDVHADLGAGNDKVSLRSIVTKGHADDYKDGNGVKIPSWYDRKSASLNLRATPTETMAFDIFYDANRSEAVFSNLNFLKQASFTDRDSGGVRAELKNLLPTLKNLTLEAGKSHQDIAVHFILPNGKQSGGNPNRYTYNGKVQADWQWWANGSTTTGIDFYKDRFQHRSNPRLVSMPNALDSKTRNIGFFVEHRQELDNSHSVVGGLRHDRKRFQSYDGGWFEAGQQRNYRNNAAFVRYENKAGAYRHHVALGAAGRSPDPWELSRSKLAAKSESSVQLDMGTAFSGDGFHYWADAFVNRIDNYLLSHKTNAHSQDLDGDFSIRNVDAMRYGFELGGGWDINKSIRLNAGLAYTWAKNKTDGTPLGQTPPLSGNVGISYAAQQWSINVNSRFSARQNRYSLGDGSISGIDTGRSSGHTVFDVSGKYTVNQALNINFGVDNLFDKFYAEHISKVTNANDFLTLYPEYRGTRIPEPGRRVWVTLAWRY